MTRASPHRAKLSATPDSGAREALLASVGLIVLLGVLKHLGFSPTVQKVGFTLAAAFQLYLPLWLIDRRRENAHDYGLHMHGSLAILLAGLRQRVLVGARHQAIGSAARRRRRWLSWWLSGYCHSAVFDRGGFVRDLRQTGLVILLTFVPFAAGHHFWQLWLASMRNKQAHYAFALPSGFAEMAVINLLLVALPEELFYRGFVHTRLVRAWPAWAVRFGVPIGRAILITSALFALGHYVGEWGNPARLGPFFPALLFSAMRARSGSIMGCVLYHGLANIFSETLRAGYTFD